MLQWMLVDHDTLMRVLSLCLNPTLDVSAQAERVLPYKKNRTSTETVEPGGGGINIVRVLASLGLSAELIYFSGGFSGQQLDSELHSLGIQRQRISIDGNTRIAFNVRDASSGAEYRFVPEGPAVDGSAGQLVLEAMKLVSLSAGDLVIGSGSLPRGLPDNFYGEISEQVAVHGARFVLDTSGVALRQALAMASRGHPIFLVKPSRSEIESLAGCSLDVPGILAAAGQLVADGAAEHVVVSLGEQGAALIDRDGVRLQKAPEVEVLSAVGAGDSFVAAMCYQIALGATMDKAFRFGVAAGAAAVITDGTRLCEVADVQRLYATMEQEAAAE